MRKIADLTIRPPIQCREKERLYNIINVDIRVNAEPLFTSEDALHTEVRNKELLPIMVNHPWQLAHASLS